MAERVNTERSERWRGLRRAALVWLALMVVSLGLHRAAWRMAPGDVPEWAEAGIKHASNVMQIATLPGWMVARGLQLWMHETKAAVVGAGVGWAMWIGAGMLAMRVRRGCAAGACDANVHEERVCGSRRAFMGNVVTVGGLGAMGGASVVTAVANPLALRVTRYRVGVEGLPQELEGLRIVQLTDLHLGARVPEGVIEEAVRRACELRADVYALTGDYIERGNAQSERVGELMAPLLIAAAIGVVGVLGNHDYYGDSSLVAAALTRAGVVMIDNGRVFIDAGTRQIVREAPGRGMCLAGVEDWSEARSDVDAALRGVPEEMARVLLSHNPDVAERCVRERHRVDLLVCGHTHGGQVRLPLIGSLFVPSAYGEKYRYGLVRGPHCRVLISAGIGVTVMPIRVGVAPELVEITLANEGGVGTG